MKHPSESIMENWSTWAQKRSNGSNLYGEELKYWSYHHKDIVREISEVLKVSDSAVHRDLVYLRKQAQENLQKHIHEVVPEEYQKCMIGMKRNLKETLEIANIVTDPRG